MTMSGTPSRLRIASAILIVSLLAAGMGTVWTRMVPLIRDEFDLSLTLFSIMTLGGAAALVAAPLADAKGARPVIAVGGVLWAASLFLLAAAPNAAFLMVGGFLWHAAGAFTGVIVLRVLAANWFVRWRGTMLGLLLVGPEVVPLLARAFYTPQPGEPWRLIPGVLALAGVAVAAIAILYLRSYPEDEQEEGTHAGGPVRRSPRRERDTRFVVYSRDRHVWVAVVVFGLAAALVQGVWVMLAFYMPTFVTRLGTDPVLSFFPTVIGLGRVAGGIAIGIAADLLGYRRTLIAAVVVAVGSFALLPVAASGDAWSMLAVAALGFGVGAVGQLILLRFVDAAGVRILGTASLGYGFLQGLGSAVILPIFGGLQDGGTGPGVAWVGVFAGLLIAATAIAMRGPGPRVEEGAVEAVSR